MVIHFISLIVLPLNNFFFVMIKHVSLLVLIMIKSITCHGFCGQLWFKNTCFAFLVNVVSMNVKIIFDLDSSFCLKYFLHL